MLDDQTVVLPQMGVFVRAGHITGVEMKLELSVSNGVLLRTKTLQKRWAAAGMARQANKMDGASDINIALSKHSQERL